MPPQFGDFAGEDPVNNSQPFLRYEPIAPPVIALVRPENADTEKPAEGESMEQIAIRSLNDTPADNVKKTDEESRRFAVPPQVSVRDAEQHGMLDAGGMVDSSKFDLLANQKDRDAKDPEAALREELIPSQGPLDERSVETVYAVYQDGREMTYLPDPLAQEVAVRVFRHPNFNSDHIITVPLYAKENRSDGPIGDRRWPDARPFKIRVFENADQAPSYDETTHTLLIPLPKAIRAQVRLSMKPSEDALAKLGVWSWLSDQDRAKFKDRALNGQHWMLTPWRTINVVHAVQRPLITPEFIKHVIDRKLGATNAEPRFQATCSIKSTDRMDLLSQWHEPVDDPSATESDKIAVDQSRGDTAYSIKISDPHTYAMQLDNHDRGGISDHTIEGPDLIGVGMPGDDRAEVKRHEFHDTRYRRIEYWLEATTRFREYMPADLLTVEFDNKSYPTDKHIKVTGPRQVTWIPNSAPPPAPQILYVVPTFGWVRTQDEDGDATRWRRGGGLRVYLDRPWMASGYGEMLAVVLPPASFSGDPETDPADHPYKKYVTQWGNDPIWLSPFVSGIAPKRSDFPLARTAPDPDGQWLPKNAPKDERDQPPGMFPVTSAHGLSSPAGLPENTAVEIAPHDVFYDEERRLWYCDIEIDQGASYFPFVRLALARYQPISVAPDTTNASSITGAHLSEVVLADFMPLTADRWLHVNHTPNPFVRRVAVYGHTYRDSSGRQEASQAPTLPDPIPGTDKVLIRKPADISGQSVIEVWVEQLDPAQGEDFGWNRVEDAIVKPDSTNVPEIDPGRKFQTGDKIARAFELRRAKRYDAIAREKLIDHIIRVQPLWSGQITLPRDSAKGDRYRLVIAEYEEYLADDDKPYDPVPEQKSRRLVFVEHVELQ